MRTQIRMPQGWTPSLATLFIITLYLYAAEDPVSQQVIFLLLSGLKNFMEDVISLCHSFNVLHQAVGNIMKCGGRYFSDLIYMQYKTRVH